MITDENMKQAGQVLASLLPQGSGFALFAMEFPKPGEKSEDHPLQYISNVKREGARAVISEWLALDKKLKP